MAADRFRAYREHDPVHWHEASRAWLITTYDDVVRLLLDPRLTSQTLGGVLDRLAGLAPAERAALRDFYARWLSLSDGSTHRQLRGLLAPVLAPTRFEPWVPMLHELAHQQAAGANPTHLEFSFARPYAAAAIGTVLGLDPQETTAALLGTGQLVRLLTTGGSTAEHAREAVDALRRMTALAGLAAGPDRRGGPTPLLSGLDLAPEIRTAIFVQLIAGGYDPLARCITSYASAGSASAGPASAGPASAGSASLSRKPLVGAGQLEEILRRHGPFELLPRIVTESMELSGRRLEPGSRVLLAIGSANLDATRFDDPLALNPGRAAAHVAFGGGTHRCPASSLARAIVEAAVRALGSC